MYNPQIKTLWKTPAPATVTTYATSVTTGKHPKDIKQLVKYLYTAGHTSIFEHSSLSAEVTGISRAFMAQITRHRFLSVTCASQHYQDHSNTHLVHMGQEEVENSSKASLCEYRSLLASGVPKEEARQVLPNSVAVKLILTANAREWAHIMNQRLCMRNVKEMQVWALAMYKVLIDWFPELFTWTVQDCVYGNCKQGAMGCMKN